MSNTNLWINSKTGLPSPTPKEQRVTYNLRWQWTDKVQVVHDVTGNYTFPDILDLLTEEEQEAIILEFVLAAAQKLVVNSSLDIA